MTRQNMVYAALMLAVLQAAGCQRSGSATASLPALQVSPCAAALAPTTAPGTLARDIARAQHQARGGPHARQALERLGYLFVARARAGNDPGDYKLAEASAGCLDARFPGEAASLLLRGHVLHQLHRFREAEAIARTLVARRTVVLDYGLLGDALMEQGHLAEAGDAYQKMIDLKPFYQSYTRAAHLRWLKGDLDGAIEVIRLAVAAASPRDPESSAWALTRLSAYELQAGRFSAAETAADAALRRLPGYAAALLARGRVLLATNRSAAAVENLREAARHTALPEYQWALGDALRLRREDAEAAVVERELTTSGASTDPRTVALYLATRRADPARALTLAEDELHRRADIFTLDAQAWALAANGRIPEARAAIARALAEGTRDGRLFLHAGVIYAASGELSRARHYLERARRLNATLLPSESAELDRHLSGTN